MANSESFVVFDNSSPEDINHAKSFWKSLTLHPPLESRLVSASIKQRLPVASPPGKKSNSCTKFHHDDDIKDRVFLHAAYQQKQKEELEKYSTVHQQRESMLNLLHKQRLERLQKEMISVPHKPNKVQQKG